MRKPSPNGLLHLYICVADHFEPAWGRANLDVQRQRIKIWTEGYPQIAARHNDSNGRSPQHTFFFPAEEYEAEHLDKLAALRRQGWGDVEVHLHHDRDTPEGLREKLLSFSETLHSRHGLLRTDKYGNIRYGFIHGNWTLNNSGPDGCWCGVDDETSILMETGCYADFTMPCAPHPAQSRKLNSLYYALPQKAPRAQDRGPHVRVGGDPPHGLLMIQGPLHLRWYSRKWGFIPRVENADVSAYNPPDPRRVRLWIRSHVHVEGAPQHVFIKLSTHGAQEANAGLLLSGGLDTMWTHLESLTKRDDHCHLHYLTAFETFCKIKELESGTAAANPPAADKCLNSVSS